MADWRLLYAAEAGDVASASAALASGASVEACAPVDMRTPLSWAAAAGHGAVVSLLLARGAKAGAADAAGRTPLHHAAHRGRADCVRLLLLGGASAAAAAAAAPPGRELLEAEDGAGATALRLAVACGCVAAVEALVAAGACVRGVEAERADVRRALHRPAAAASAGAVAPSGPAGDWGRAEAAAWLEGAGFGAYRPQLAPFSGADLLLLDDAELKELGLPTAVRRSLLAAVAALP